MNTPAGLLLASLVLSAAPPALAQDQPIDLSSATLEDLMNIEITSASRKEQRAEDVPAAVYVITRDDIRRSGMTSVPDVLRLVPGVQVAQINSNKWAVSVRGFNSLFSNKLLVLVDGRSVYNPLFSAVLWDTEDLMLEDVDRIEVIRGPGAAVWGANAVNGVINILTSTAADTNGLLVRAGVGTFDRGSVAVRYGGDAGSGAYRVYTQISALGDSVLASQTDANDHWRSVTTGFRGDWSTGPETFMVQGSVAIAKEQSLWVNLDPAASGQSNTGGTADTQVGNVLGRWTHARSDGGTLHLQSFVDIAHRRESISEYHRHTLDLDAAYHTVLGGRHDLVVGGGFRYIREAIDGGVGYSFTPDHTNEGLTNAFAQDEISLAGRRVTLTVGSKFEHDSIAGSSLQPTARIMWNVKRRQRLWAAVSRAVRTPSLVDYGLRVDFPPAIPAGTPGAPPSDVPVALSIFGNPAIQNERLVSAETGYRLDIGSKAAIDVAGFFGHYQSLQTIEPSAPTVTFVDGRPLIHVSAMLESLLGADTRGVEIAGRVALGGAWQVDGSFSAFHLTPHPDAASHDATTQTYDGHAPTYQWRGHSALSLGPRATADVLLFYVGSLGQLGVPAYTRADVRFEGKLTRHVSVSARGHNLLSPAHAEFASDQTIVSTRVPRGGSLRLTWRF